MGFFEFRPHYYGKHFERLLGLMACGILVTGEGYNKIIG
ncbi:hypothetical protein HNQ56_000446 [Anaerotaenia torta]